MPEAAFFNLKLAMGVGVASKGTTRQPRGQQEDLRTPCCCFEE
jgi:hypothetical protein